MRPIQLARHARRRAAIGVLVAALAACQAAPPGGPARTGPARAAAAGAARGGATPAATASPAATGERPPLGAGIRTDAGSGVVSNNGGNLVGVVRAPARLVSDLGGSIISDNGLGIIANNGGGVVSNNGGNVVAGSVGTGSLGGGVVANGGARFRLAALDQVPLAGATVRLLDGAGEPVRDAAGRPLVATTDGQGRYAFSVALSARNGLVRIDLPGERGRLEAIVPPAGERRVADIDAVSTLTTGYILDRYVATQPDRQATLDRLPTDVEADTRAKAQAALEAGRAGLPDAFTPLLVARTVDALRAGDPAFDGQMEAVRKLLIPAGQSDLGDGRPALEVPLGEVRSLLLAPDGALYVNCAYDHRVWRLRSDGRLETAAGAGGHTLEADFGSLAGQPAVSARLVPIQGVSFDGTGRLLVLEGAADPAMNNVVPRSRLTRREADGTLAELWGDAPRAVAVAPAADGALLVLTGGRPATWPVAEERTAALWRLEPGQKPTLLHRFGEREGEVVRRAHAYGVDPAGRLYVASVEDPASPGATAVYRIDPAAPALTRVAGERADGLAGLALDPGGAVVALAAGTRRLTARLPDGAERELMARLPDGLALAGAAVAIAPDGGAYLAHRGRVHRLRDGRAEAVAGEAGAAAASAADLALREPAGIAVAADGTLFVADHAAHRVVRVAPDRSVRLVAGTGEAGDVGDGGPATAARLDGPGAVRLGSDRSLYVLDRDGRPGNRIRRVAPDGGIATAFAAASDETALDVLVAPAGGLYVPVARPDRGVEVRTIVAGAAPTVAFSLPPLSTALDAYAFTIDGAGTVWVGGAGLDDGGPSLRRWTPGGALTPVPGTENTFLFNGEDGPAGDRSPLAIDPAGQAYLGSASVNWIVRFAPERPGRIAPVAGEGGLHFAGKGVDDSIAAPRYLTFDARGDLYFADTGHKQIKRVPLGGE